MDTSMDKLKERVENLNKLIKGSDGISGDEQIVSQWRGEQIQILKMIIRKLEDGEAVLQ
jgi:hypothetical protein|tara:strand:- start:344 stop:520 length:177 start_codon:yes stop_codon:yes gene_type:complete